MVKYEHQHNVLLFIVQFLIFICKISTLTLSNANVLKILKLTKTKN